MPLFTVQSLVDRAAAAADMHDTFVSPATWLSWYNVERQALQLFMARHGAAMQDYTITIATTPSSTEYTFTGEFLAVVGVWESKSNQFFRQLKIVPFVDLPHQFNNGPVRGPSQLVSILDLSKTDTGETLFSFYPHDTTGSYIIVTLAVPDTATAMTDSDRFVLGLEERIVLGMARRALIKEESDTSAIDKLLKESEQLVEEYVWGRAFYEVPSIRNNDKNKFLFPSGLVYPPFESWYWA